MANPSRSNRKSASISLLAEILEAWRTADDETRREALEHLQAGVAAKEAKAAHQQNNKLAEME